MTGIARAATYQPPEPGPSGRAGGVAERPDSDLREPLGQPIRPGSGVVLPPAPGGECIAAEAMYEDDICLACGVAGARDLMQPVQSSDSFHGAWRSRPIVE